MDTKSKKAFFYFNVTSLIALLSVLFSPFVAAQTTCLDNKANDKVIATTPSSEFSIHHSDGTVTQRSTGLMWMRCAKGQTWNKTGLNEGTCTGKAEMLRWIDMMNSIDEFNKTGWAGYNDWRVPNIKELASILEEQCYDPYINIKLFPLVQSHDSFAFHFWSSSWNSYTEWTPDPDFQLRSYVRVVNFRTGEAGAYLHHNEQVKVRLVRNID